MDKKRQKEGGEGVVGETRKERGKEKMEREKKRDVGQKRENEERQRGSDGEKDGESSRDLIEKKKKKKKGRWEETRDERGEDALYKTLPLLPLPPLTDAGVCFHLICVCVCVCVS